MRDPERLDSFYEELKKIHKEDFPDWRFGQFMMNFLGWLQIDEKVDPFFPEEQKMLSYLKGYVEDIKNGVH